MLLSLLAGCWLNFAELSTLNVSEVAFSNEHLSVSNVWIRMFDSPLICPDGDPAPFFLVYPESEDILPVAIVFHTGALDYGAFVPEGSSFNATGRLTSNWASSRVWETLNMARQSLDTSVTDLGHLPTALTNAGIAQLYPSNCWGDYWHNGEVVNLNDSTAEGYTRQGLDMAQLMINLLENEQLAGDLNFKLEQQFNPDETYWIGMGSGGQAIVELLLKGTATPSGIVFDSYPASLQPYLSGEDLYSFEQEAFARIFGEEDPAEYSLNNINILPAKTAWIWSNGDPQHPRESLETGADIISEVEGSWVEDQNENAHVFINKDIDLANRVVNFLLTGNHELPASPEDTGE